MPAIARILRSIFAVLAGFALALMFTLLLCLLFAYRSTAYGQISWTHLVGTGDRLAQATRYDSLGKTIQSWRALSAGERDEFRSRGTVARSAVKLGPDQPPAWSAFWDDAAFELAARSSGTQRYDIAVGWPWRAFACPVEDEHDESVTRDGVPLPMIMVQRATYATAELRAIPLRPLWRGLALDALVLWPLCAAALFLLLRYGIPALQLARDVPRYRPARASSPPPRRIAAASRFVLLGLCTAAFVTAALPLLLRARVVETGATDRMDAWLESDLLWRSRGTQLSIEEAQDQSPAAALTLIHTLESLHYSGIPSRQLRSQGPQMATPQFFANRRIFSAIQTGWPFTAMWGASWTIGPSSTSSTGIFLVPPKSGALSVFSRGQREVPTHPIWRAWAANTLFYALLWWALIRLLLPFFLAARATHRLRRGRCPACAYDLRATPTNSPCPECGSPRRTLGAGATPLA